MNLKKSQNRNLNFTNRKKIKLKDTYLKVNIKKREKNELKLDLSIDKHEILKSIHLADDPNLLFILEAFFHGIRQRIEFDVYGNPDSTLIKGCPDKTTPSFRFSIVQLGDETGKILASTSHFTPKENVGEAGNEGSRKNNFFDLKPRDSLGGSLWSVDWSDEGNPEILINRRLLEAGYDGDNKFVRTFVFSEILREILNGMMFRLDSIDDIAQSSKLDKWKVFCQQKLEIDFEIEFEEPLQKIDWINKVIESFMNKKWVKNKTLLDSLVA